MSDNSRDPELTQLLRDAMTHLWFKARAFGWGWTPVSVEGWAVVIAFLALVLAGIGVFIYQLRAGADVRSANLLFLAWIGLLIAMTILPKRSCGRSGELMALWNDVLPVVQQINNDGGNFTSFLLSRSVFELLDVAANVGDAAAMNTRSRIRRTIKSGNWPQDPTAFNAVFESYHEGLFYLLAKDRGVDLHYVKEVAGKTPDFSAHAYGENYEVKTLDMSGGANAYHAIAKVGRESQRQAREEAKKRGVGFGETCVNPHGTAENWLQVMQRVMRQIGRNVKQGQFQEKPTFLVVALPRTSIRGDAAELKELRQDARLGRVNGHLWTLAAHRVGDHFWWPHPDGFQHDPTRQDNDNGPLSQNGILRDFPFLRGVVFIDTTWNKLGSADVVNPRILGEGYALRGVWNDAFTPLGQTPDPPNSSFRILCHDWVRAS